MQSEKPSSTDPVFIIGLALLGVQAFWNIVPKLIPNWYQGDFYLVTSIITSLIVPGLCIYFVKSNSHRTALIVLVFLLMFMRMADQLQR